MVENSLELMKERKPKIDRFLCDINWEQAYPLSLLSDLPRLASDHVPLQLSTGNILRRNKNFKMESGWKEMTVCNLFLRVNIFQIIVLIK